ncbi:hypothetical protein WICPIJ_007062 [Wickerhamomyces pijperi]|uniref:Pirin n=1 Tax=Wickerhamomyces pijperi TaxID=599730 RepID=A0A9P8TKB3_WICPI|nr:hypothetical protein WICPIJ_007062 [Wickerhamomyces pijperi]
MSDLSRSPTNATDNIDPITTTLSQTYLNAHQLQTHHKAQSHPEGVNLTVSRTIGPETPIPHQSPFLLLDHFSLVSTPATGTAGFPDHPHHGQETITYLLSGSVAHEDFIGNKGLITKGGLQVMFAGKGIVHAEMPILNSAKRGKPQLEKVEGIQLWLDLPKELKTGKPKYKDITEDKIPTVTAEDGQVKVKVVSGEAYGVKSKLKSLSYAFPQLVFYDYEVTPNLCKVEGAEMNGESGALDIKQYIPNGFTILLYVLQGTLTISTDRSPTLLRSQTIALFEPEGDHLHVKIQHPKNKPTTTRFIIIAAPPILTAEQINTSYQPVHMEGPFVETSKEKLQQVIENYQLGIKGFEKSKGWKSSIRDGVTFDYLNNDQDDKGDENWGDERNRRSNGKKKVNGAKVLGNLQNENSRSGKGKKSSGNGKR